MIDPAMPAALDLPDWLSATFEESLSAEWMTLVRSCMREIEALFWEKYPDLIEVFFDEARGDLRIHAVTTPSVPWMQAFPMHAITEKYQALAKDGMESQGGVTKEPAATGFESPCPADEQASESPVIEESPNVDGDENPPALDLDEEVEDKAVDEQRGKSCPVRVFRGLSVGRSSDAASATRDDDTCKRLKITMRRLRERGWMRPLQYPSLDWERRLDRLELEFPNFRAVIQTIILPHLGLLSRGHFHRMVPTLLVGEPGIGKTQFARELQAILGVPALFLVMAEETNGSGLSGSSSFWSNASPGKLFEEVAWGNGRDPVANPLVVIDEVDKVSESRYDPLAGLYSLLETETAARFEDQAVPGVSLDLSHVRFILTANDENEIPSPLRSRVRTFHIELPDADEMRRIAQRIFVSLLEKYNLALKPELPASVLEDILEIGPREAKIRLDAAIAIAVTHDQSELDLVSWRMTDCGSEATLRKIGFL